MAVKTKDKGAAQVAEVAERLETLHVERVPIDSIVPNSYNPNRQNPKEFELLLRSMREDGFTTPIVVQKGTNEIVDGEHRWRAARQLLKDGEWTNDMIPVVFVDMTAEQMRVATLRHNRARGSEDYELAASLLRDLRELGALDKAAESLMLDDKELNRLLDDSSVAEKLAGESFSQAWEPGVEPLGMSDVGVEGETRTHSESGAEIHRPTFAAATPEAVERLQASRQAMIDAVDASERQQVIQQRQVYRLQLSFTGDEATVVKMALGNQPAVTVLEMCREVLASTEAVPETAVPDIDEPQPVAATAEA